MKELVILMNILDISETSSAFEKGILPTVITAKSNEVLSSFQENYACVSIGNERSAYYLHAIKSNEKVVGIIEKDGGYKKVMENPTPEAMIKVYEDGTYYDISLVSFMKEQLSMLRASEEKKEVTL